MEKKETVTGYIEEKALQSCFHMSPGSSIVNLGDYFVVLS